MIFDMQSLFENGSAIAGTRTSTNVIDLGVANRNIGNGIPIPIEAVVTTTLTGGTSLALTLETDSLETLASGTAIVHASSGAIAVASLTAGYRFTFDWVPQSQSMKRYMGLRLTIVGTMTAGAIIAGFVMGHQSNLGT